MKAGSVALFMVLAAHAGAVEMGTGANPIRKIVTLMQNMQKEIEAEGEKEKELFDKFMCFCSANTGDLGKAEADAKAKAEEMAAKLKSETAEKSQIEQELVDHKSDRETAKSDLAEATTLREKEKAEYDAMKADSETNIAAMASAIPAIEKGMGGAALLQMPAGQRIRKLVESFGNMDPMDRRNALAFLEQGSGSEEYSTGAGEILGILKQMKDEFEANLASAVSDEEAAVEGFNSLQSSKETEIEVATEAIETKTARSGELAVSVVQTKDALEDAQEEIANAGKYAEQLAKQCAEKEKEWAARQQARADEIKAISQAIGILNDDDALDVFKKSSAGSFFQQPTLLQRSSHRASPVKTAQAMLAHIAAKYESVPVKLMLYTMKSKLNLKSAGGMDEVVKMIDDMVVLLGKQQKEDDTAKEVCEKEFDIAEDEEKAAKTKLEQLSAAMTEASDAISGLMQEIADLKKGIEELDYSVAEATEQRKEEHAEYLEAVQMNEAAIGLVGKAKNKLQQFYNPSLAKKAAASASASSASFIQAATFAQVRAHSDEESLFEVAPPPPPPDTFGGEVKKNEKSAGVMGMMDSIVRDLENDVKDAEYEEKTAAKEYGELMGESQETRAADSKAIVDKTAAKAEHEGKLMETKEALAAASEDVKLAAATIQDLHGRCDFIMQNYDMRKEARANEVDSLKNAKAVLSGAQM
jgi:chromosome segregation ATPase